MTNYEDIIDMPHHVSLNRRRMSNVDRAAQFSSFEALTGYGEQIDEAARLTDVRPTISAEQIDELNNSMNYLMDNIALCPMAEIVYFIPDEKKVGGKFVTLCMNIRKVDLVNRAITDTNNNVLDIDRICELKVKKRPLL